MKDQPIIVKKVKKTAAAHHGGSWKVAFADFMTAMMAFFLVMWIIGLDEETKSAIAGYFNDPLNFMKKQSASRLENILEKTALTQQGGTDGGKTDELTSKMKDEEVKQLSKVQDELEKTLQEEPDLKEMQKYVKTALTDEGLVIEFVEGAGSVFFESGSARVRPRANKLFLRLGTLLARAKRRVVLDGHTDAQPYAGAGYDNMDLSQDRARSARHVLLLGGMRPEAVLASRGFGDQRLREPSKPFDSTNRRVSVLLPFIWKEEAVVGSAGKMASGGAQGMISERINIAPRLNSSK